MSFGRQLQGELRKLGHPLTALAVVGIATGISLLQVSHDSTPYPGPSLVDGLGCIRIAALQHATALGFGLAGIFAAVGTASEAGSGALADMLLREPRRGRVVLIKWLSIVLAMGLSLSVSTAGLWLTSIIVRANDNVLPAVGRSNARDTGIDVACSLLVIPLASALALVVALLARSIIATVVVVAAAFYLPLSLLQARIFWATPTRWVIEWLHLDPFGEGVDYIARNSPFDRRGVPAVVAGILIVLATAGLAALSKPLLSRAVLRHTEHNV